MPWLLVAFSFDLSIFVVFFAYKNHKELTTVAVNDEKLIHLTCARW